MTKTNFKFGLHGLIKHQEKNFMCCLGTFHRIFDIENCVSKKNVI